MKISGFISSLFLVLILILVFPFKKDVLLKTGDISFLSMDADNDGFSIITYVNIQPRTTIRFTDSEWNGNRFGVDENDISWNTGKDTIQAGSVIEFNNTNSISSVTNGTIQGKLKISKKHEAIFAYIGSSRMPVKFLAAIANDVKAYGTLTNTGLTDGNSTITTSP